MQRAELTVKDLLKSKGRRQLTEVYASTPEEARACEAAGIDLIVTSERNNTPAIRSAAPVTFLTIGLVYGDYVTAGDTVRGGFEALKNGADAVYAGVGLQSVRLRTLAQPEGSR